MWPTGGEEVHWSIPVVHASMLGFSCGGRSDQAFAGLENCETGEAEASAVPGLPSLKAMGKHHRGIRGSEILLGAFPPVWCSWGCHTLAPMHVAERF